ncbi:hypothetical protein VI817_001280 [Penicillium citrinum]|nr:hypothetical protein VI817_001280 [Penicillium citrinum]
MPATDALRKIDRSVPKVNKLTCIEPILTPEQRTIVKQYGGWTAFMQCFGLKPWEDDDVQEGLAILRAFATDDDDDDEK